MNLWKEHSTTRSETARRGAPRLILTALTYFCIHLVLTNIPAHVMCSTHCSNSVIKQRTSSALCYHISSSCFKITAKLITYVGTSKHLSPPGQRLMPGASQAPCSGQLGNKACLEEPLPNHSHPARTLMARSPTNLL